MTSNPKKQSLSREQAGAIYDDLQRVMASLLEKQKMGGGPVPSGAAKAPHGKNVGAKPSLTPARVASDEHPGLPLMLPTKPNRGHFAALALVGIFALGKVAVAALEMSGVLVPSAAQATMTTTSVSAAKSSLQGVTDRSTSSKSEIAVLTALDHRRAELEERAMRLDERESELEKRDKEFVARQSELKELTDIIRSDRDRGEKKRSSQLEQLSNVYGSMNPPEAAALIEQLDVNIALGLLERMPEKRIGQILALMNPERALSITKMLSGRGAEQK
jgi:flagellar motility protein MotE (MotC chaperone)